MKKAKKKYKIYGKKRVHSDNGNFKTKQVNRFSNYFYLLLLFMIYAHA